MKATVTDGVGLADRYRRSTELMRAEMDYPEHILHEIINHFVNECERARVYNWPERTLRERDGDIIKEAALQAKHTRALAKYLNQYPIETMTATVGAMEATDSYMLTSNGEEPIALSSLWLSRLLDALADQLQNKRLLSRTGPVAHQWQHGPLWLERSVEGRARSALPDPETCLAIYLSFVFRRLTPEGDIRRRNDKFEPMPTDGNPRWPIVAALVRDALDARTDEQELIAKSRKRIRSNPGLRIIGYL